MSNFSNNSTQNTKNAAQTDYSQTIFVHGKHGKRGKLIGVAALTDENASGLKSSATVPVVMFRMQGAGQTGRIGDARISPERAQHNPCTGVLCAKVGFTFLVGGDMERRRLAGTHFCPRTTLKPQKIDRAGGLNGSAGSVGFPA
jgi:hypothetical protein